MDYTINVAKCYTESNWQGNRAYKHHCKVVLGHDVYTLELAQVIAAELAVAYPSPDYRLTISKHTQSTSSWEFTS
jgi:hypothetical protein